MHLSAHKWVLLTINPWCWIGSHAFHKVIIKQLISKNVSLHEWWADAQAGNWSFVNILFYKEQPEWLLGEKISLFLFSLFSSILSFKIHIQRQQLRYFEYLWKILSETRRNLHLGMSEWVTRSCLTSPKDPNTFPLHMCFLSLIFWSEYQQCLSRQDDFSHPLLLQRYYKLLNVPHSRSFRPRTSKQTQMYKKAKVAL